MRIERGAPPFEFMGCCVDIMTNLLSRRRLRPAGRWPHESAANDGRNACPRRNTGFIGNVRVGAESLNNRKRSKLTPGPTAAACQAQSPPRQPKGIAELSFLSSISTKPKSPLWTPPLWALGVN